MSNICEFKFRFNQSISEEELDREYVNSYKDKTFILKKMILNNWHFDKKKRSFEPYE